MRHTCAYTHAHKYTHAHRHVHTLACSHACTLSHTCTHARLHKHMHTHTHAHTITHARTRTHARARARAHTHTHTPHQSTPRQYTSLQIRHRARGPGDTNRRGVGRGHGLITRQLSAPCVTPPFLAALETKGEGGGRGRGGTRSRSNNCATNSAVCGNAAFSCRPRDKEAACFRYDRVYITRKRHALDTIGFT